MTLNDCSTILMMTVGKLRDELGYNLVLNTIHYYNLDQNEQHSSSFDNKLLN